jgi:hypothetical protein
MTEAPSYDLIQPAHTQQHHSINQSIHLLHTCCPTTCSTCFAAIREPPAAVSQQPSYLTSTLTLMFMAASSVARNLNT